MGGGTSTPAGPTCSAFATRDFPRPLDLPVGKTHREQGGRNEPCRLQVASRAPEVGFLDEHARRHYPDCVRQLIEHLLGIRWPVPSCWWVAAASPRRPIRRPTDNSVTLTPSGLEIDDTSSQDALSYLRKDDTTTVRLGDSESYDIPDALINGG